MDTSNRTAETNATIEETIHDESPSKRQHMEHLDLTDSRLDEDDDTCPVCAWSATGFARPQQFEQHKKFCRGTQAKIPACQCGKVWRADDGVERHRASCFVCKALENLVGQLKISHFFGVKPAQPQPQLQPLDGDDATASAEPQTQPLDGDDATANAEPERTICQGWKAVEWPQPFWKSYPFQVHRPTEAHRVTQVSWSASSKGFLVSDACKLYYLPGDALCYSRLQAAASRQLPCLAVRPNLTPSSAAGR